MIKYQKEKRITNSENLLTLNMHTSFRFLVLLKPLEFEDGFFLPRLLFFSLASDDFC